MTGADAAEKERANSPRWDGRRRGWYEVYFLKLNLPAEAAAFWIRYTFSVPQAKAEEPCCELWCAYFDARDPTRKLVLKKRLPIDELMLGREPFRVGIGPAMLEAGACRGRIVSGGHDLAWELGFDSSTPVLYHLPYRWLYRTALPRTKALCPHLDARFTGRLTVDGREFEATDAPGQQEHVWGTRHNQRWAWGHCNTFAQDRAAVWEAVDAQVKHGPFTSAHFKMIYLKTGGREYCFNAPRQWLENRSQWQVGNWNFSARDKRIRLEGQANCRLEDLVGVTYADPDGSELWCNNTKLASLKIELYTPAGRKLTELSSDQGAAVEFADHHKHPGVPVLV